MRTSTLRWGVSGTAPVYLIALGISQSNPSTGIGRANGWMPPRMKLWSIQFGSSATCAA